MPPNAKAPRWAGLTFHRQGEEHSGQNPAFTPIGCLKNSTSISRKSGSPHSQIGRGLCRNAHYGFKMRIRSGSRRCHAVRGS